VTVDELPLFDEVAETLRALLPPDFDDVQMRSRRWGIKVWFGGRDPGREHYEAQVLGRREVPEATVLAIEVGFHAEHRNPADNEAALAVLTATAAEKRWRKVLGAEPVAGGFLGRADDWRRVSETMIDPDLGDPELGMELAARLTDYITTLEPLRRARS
jgi:hypothetical protein